MGVRKWRAGVGCPEKLSREGGVRGGASRGAERSRGRKGGVFRCWRMPEHARRRKAGNGKPGIENVGKGMVTEGIGASDHGREEDPAMG